MTRRSTRECNGPRQVAGYSVGVMHPSAHGGSIGSMRRPIAVARARLGECALPTGHLAVDVAGVSSRFFAIPNPSRSAVTHAARDRLASGARGGQHSTARDLPSGVPPDWGTMPRHLLHEADCKRRPSLSSSEPPAPGPSSSTRVRAGIPLLSTLLYIYFRVSRCLGRLPNVRDVDTTTRQTRFDSHRRQPQHFGHAAALSRPTWRAVMTLRATFAGHRPRRKASSIRLAAQGNRRSSRLGAETREVYAARSSARAETLERVAPRYGLLVRRDRELMETQRRGAMTLSRALLRLQEIRVADDLLSAPPGSLPTASDDCYRSPHSHTRDSRSPTSCAGPKIRPVIASGINCCRAADRAAPDSRSRAMGFISIC